jgi:hypothetical protein
MSRNDTFAKATNLGSFQSGKNLKIKGSLEPTQRSDFFTFQFTSKASDGSIGFSNSSAFATSEGKLFYQQGSSRRLVNRFGNDTSTSPFVLLKTGRYFIQLTGIPTTSSTTGKVTYSLQATLS